MTAASVLSEALAPRCDRAPIGRDWLADLRNRFAEEFPDDPEDEMARRAVERGVAADRKQISRPVRAA